MEHCAIFPKTVIKTFSASGMYIPHQEPGHSSAFLIGLNSYEVGVNVEITFDIKPRKRDGLIFAVEGSSGAMLVKTCRVHFCVSVVFYKAVNVVHKSRFLSFV